MKKLHTFSIPYINTLVNALNKKNATLLKESHFLLEDDNEQSALSHCVFILPHINIFVKQKLKRTTGKIRRKKPVALKGEKLF